MTLPQKASAAPASKLRKLPIKPPAELICPAEEIFDQAAIRQQLETLIKTAPNERDIRALTISCLSEAQKTGRSRIAESFLTHPFKSRAVTRSYTYLTDCLVAMAFEVANGHIHKLNTPTKGERLTLLAVGGYGRAEMAPFSDVDLLFLTPYKITPWAESVIESMLYILWDLRLKVGHASRTIKDCLRLGKEDYTIRTALLENRYLVGHAPLGRELNNALSTQLFQGSEVEFIEAKLAERDQRHKKQGLRYVVEPNVKEGKGGLRDLQSMFWIAKYLHGVKDTKELVKLKVFTPEEYASFERAEAFLWAVRCHLHLVAKRATEQLTFDMQVEVADRLGYRDHTGRRAVEHFMQDYFRHATRVGELTRIFLTALESEQIKKEPLLVGFFRRRKKLRHGFVITGGRIGFASEEEFLSDKLNLLRIFEEALRTGYLIHPDAMRAIVANLDLIDADMRQNKEAVRIFMDLLLKHGNPERSLRRMNELGVLSAFIPEFEPIVAMMQFNMYHSYTVDEHTIQCISNLAQIERGELIEALPVATGILEEGVNRKVLYVALLLHDIGKGRDEDHSILGAQIARKVAPRLGLKKAECESVEWLVRNHLLMSDVAQKRDISDPSTIRAFAKQVKSKEWLDLLTVLTVCDIRGVGPHTWNNWKATLIRSLHSETAAALKDGLGDLNRGKREQDAKRALREALPDWPAKEVRAEIKRHYGPYWQGLSTDDHVTIARLLRNLSDDEIGVDLLPDIEHDATRVCFAMVDHPGIFTRIAGALALVGANVVDARTYTSGDGYITPVFWIQDAEHHPYEISRLPRLRQMIERILKGEVIAGQALASRDKIKKRESEFRIPTRIIFDNEGSDIYTIIEVDTRDRPGLLFDLARTFANANMSIATAQIATYGIQAVDTFYVKDMFGLKLYAESKQASLAAKLRTAIEQGAERAADA